MAKKETYKLSIYNLTTDKTLEELMELYKSKVKHPNEMQDHDITEYNEETDILYLSHKNKNNSDINWYKKWKSLFPIKDSLRSERVMGNGAIIIHFKRYNTKYLLTFGNVYSIMKECINQEYGIKMASKLFDGNSMDTVSSKYFSLSKNKSMVSYVKDTMYQFQEGEAVDLLKSNITEVVTKTENLYIERLLSYIKPMAAINYSNIKLTLVAEEIALSNIVEVLDLLYKIEIEYQDRFKIPYMNAVKKDKEVELNNQLLTAIKNRDSSILFSVPFFGKDEENSYVFLDNIDNVKLIYKCNSENYNSFSNDDLFNFVMKYPDIDDITKIQCNVTRAGYTSKDYDITKWIEAQIEVDNTSFALYDGKWYTFNENYLSIVTSKIEEIEGKVISFDYSYSTSKDNVEKFCSGNVDEILKRYSSKDCKYEDIYREFKYNFYISKQKNFLLFDRHIENGVEICDLANVDDKAFIHCKIGKTSNLEECIRQAILSMKYYFQNNHNGKEFVNNFEEVAPELKKVHILFLFESEKKYFKISTSKSLKCKLTFMDWYNLCGVRNLDCKIIIAHYDIGDRK